MYVKVQVTTKAKEEKLLEQKPQYLKVSVREKAERNLANNRVVAMVAAHYGVKEGKIRIVSGHHHPAKMLSVEVEGETLSA